MERRLANKAIRHWREWLPNRYRELLEANELVTAAAAAAAGAAREIKELMQAGARLDEAEEVVLPKWILLPPEEPDPEEPDWEATELADREAAYQRLQASLDKAERDANLLFPQ